MSTLRYLRPHLGFGSLRDISVSGPEVVLVNVDDINHDGTSAKRDDAFSDVVPPHLYTVGLLTNDIKRVVSGIGPG